MNKHVTKQGRSEYLKTQVLTASREQLLLMLYDGAIRFSTQAKEKMAERDCVGTHELLVRAQRVVVELMSALNPDVDAVLCQRLSALYSFVYVRLVKANVERSPKLVDEGLEVLTKLRDTWAEAVVKLKEEGEGASLPAPPQGRVSVRT